MKKRSAKTTSKGVKNKKRKHYKAYNLALILAVLVLLESALILIPASVDWQEALSLFDASNDMERIESQFAGMFSEVSEVVAGVNKFYNQAADEMVYLLSGKLFPEVKEVIGAVSLFYQEASNELVALLDTSGHSGWSGRVVGVTIENY